EIHVHQSEFHYRPGNFRPEAERNAFVRLNMNDQLVGAGVLDWRLAEQHERRTTKTNGDLGYASAQALAGAQVKGTVAPASIVYFQFQRDEGFRVGTGRYVWLATVCGDSLTVDAALAVLAANHILQNFFRRRHLYGVEDFGLLVAHRVGFKGDWRFHRREREQLNQMIRNHVTEGAGSFIERSAVFNSDRFGCGDLHVIDVSAVPEWLDDAVGKAKHHQ